MGAIFFGPAYWQEEERQQLQAPQKCPNHHHELSTVTKSSGVNLRSVMFHLVCILLNLVITEGAHIATKSEVTKKWSAVNDAFFNQNEARLWKDELYKNGDFRKIRDKFKQTMTVDIDTAKSRTSVSAC
jgi:hypothetical protein